MFVNLKIWYCKDVSWFKEYDLSKYFMEVDKLILNLYKVHRARNGQDHFKQKQTWEAEATRFQELW